MTNKSKKKADMCQEFGLINDPNDLKKKNCIWSQGIKNKAISNAWQWWGITSSGFSKREV